jgi:hypothetical protein
LECSNNWKTCIFILIKNNVQANFHALLTSSLSSPDTLRSIHHNKDVLISSQVQIVKNTRQHNGFEQYLLTIWVQVAVDSGRVFSEITPLMTPVHRSRICSGSDSSEEVW